MKRRITIVLASVALAACGGGSSGADAGRDTSMRTDAASVPLVDIAVSITSSVPSFDGRVLVGAFRMDPPTMPPVASTRLGGGTPPMAVTFPTTTTLRNVEPGTYWVLGVLDFDPPSPTLPGPEDTTGTVGPITIDGSANVSVDLVLPAR